MKHLAKKGKERRGISAADLMYFSLFHVEGSYDTSACDAAQKTHFDVC